MNAEQLFLQLNELDEHSQVEAKTSSDIGDPLLETICAYANEPGLGGGYLLLGVSPAKDVFWPTYEVVGIDDTDKLQANIATQSNSVFNRPVRPRMTVETLKGRNVITVYVPESGPSEKPIYFQKRGLPLGAFRRIGSSNHKCSEDDLRLFYREHHTRTFDDEVFDDSSLDDMDQTAIQQYRDMRAVVYPEADELLLDDDELLRSLSCAKFINGDLKPTVAGLVLFGKRSALRRCFPMMRVDYIRVPTKEWVSDPDRRFDTIEIREPLVRAIQKVRAAILDESYCQLLCSEEFFKRRIPA